MYNIILICTFHIENGKCNSNELYKLIEIINPEIIFQEIDSIGFKAYCEYPSRKTLETNAIKMYLQNHQIEHIPVDTYDFTHFRKEDFDYMIDKIGNNSIEYFNLLKEQFCFASQYGFSYLNSIQCSETIEKMHNLEINVLKDINDEKLFYTYKLWTELNDKRDNEIIDNIYNYSNEHMYNKATLIIGTEHKRSIMKKIQESKRKEKLNWEFNYFKNAL